MVDRSPPPPELAAALELSSRELGLLVDADVIAGTDRRCVERGAP